VVGTFSLENSALIYPDAGFDTDGEHFGVMGDGQKVGTIYRIGDEWLWSIYLGMMGAGSGRAASRREARAALRAAWDDGPPGSARRMCPRAGGGTGQAIGRLMS
jgi:hypothetical protein